MGAIIGRITEETPNYKVIKTGEGYEVRVYDPILVAQVGGMDGNLNSKATSQAFMQLARYIGVFSTPENVAGGKGEKISMTAPVLVQGMVEGQKPEEIAMTAPVLMEDAPAKPEKIAMTAPVLMEDAPDVKPEKISMTAPVLMESSAESSGSSSGRIMQFVLPSKYTMETIPKPTNPNIVLKEIPERMVGAVTFSGTANPENCKPREEALAKALTEAGYRITGKAIFAGYNPPFTLPWLKKNELLIPVEPPVAAAT